MSVPLKFLTEDAGPTCARCGGASKCVRFNFFIASFVGETEPVCLHCLLEGAEENVAMQDLTPPAPSKRKKLRKQKKLATKQELEIADELGGRVQKASGALAHAKGDVRVKDRARLEAKHTKARSYRLELDDLYKIISEAGVGETPVLTIDFREEYGRLIDRFAVIPFDNFKELLDAAREDR